MEREMTNLKKILTGAAAALTLSIVTLSAGTTTAEAGWKHKHWHKHHWHGHHYYNPYVYGFYGPSGCFVKWTKYGKAYVCL
jgi:hypothetical protein